MSINIPLPFLFGPESQTLFPPSFPPNTRRAIVLHHYKDFVSNHEPNCTWVTERCYRVEKEKIFKELGEVWFRECPHCGERVDTYKHEIVVYHRLNSENN